MDDRSSPDWVKTQASLTLARAHDLGGQRAEAMKLYARVAEEHERDNIGWAAKVGLVTPYQRPKR